MAMLRDEVAGQVGSLSSLKPFVDAGNGTIALGIGGAVEPQAVELADSDKGRSIAALVQALSELARLTAAPAGVPDAVLQELRDAYWASVTDPDLLAEAAKLDIPIEPANGADVEELVKAALDQSPETVEIIAAAVDVKIPTITVTTELMAVNDDGREIEFMSGDATFKAGPSGSRTRIMIDGAEAKRDKLAAGMMCEIEYDPANDDNEPKTMDCKG
jgi:hypothetical protein